MKPSLGAGWSSPVARQAHNLKVAGSNPAPATNKTLPTPEDTTPHLAVSFAYASMDAKAPCKIQTFAIQPKEQS